MKIREKFYSQRKAYVAARPIQRVKGARRDKEAPKDNLLAIIKPQKIRNYLRWLVTFRNAIFIG